MSNTLIVILIAKAVVVRETMSNVIRIEQCDFSRFREPSAAEHLDIRPRD